MPEKDNAKISRIISRSRMLLLVACYSASTAALLICVALLYDFLVQTPNTSRLVIVVQFVLSITAITQIVYNERLLRPIIRYFSPQLAIPLIKSGIKVFLILMVFFVGVFLFGRFLNLTSEMAFWKYLLLSSGTGLTAVILMIVILWGVNKEESSPALVADAIVKLPFKSAFCSLLLWLFASVAISIPFRFFAGLSVVKCYAFFVLIISAGVLAFPLQYLIFKRITEPLYIESANHGIVLETSLFKISIRRKIMLGMSSLLVFTVGFYGLLNYLKAYEILQQNTKLFLSDIIEEISIQAQDISSEMTKRGERFGAIPFYFERGQGDATKLNAHYKQLLKAIEEDDNKKIVQLSGDDVVIWRSNPATQAIFGFIYPYERMSLLLGKVKKNAVYFGLLTFIFVALIAWLLSRDIAIPLEVIRRNVGDFARERREKLALFFSDDETLELFEGCRAMMREILKQLRRSEELVESINLTVQHLNSSAGEMEVIAKEQSVGSAQQAAAIQQTLTTAGEIAASAKYIEESAATVEGVTAETMKHCEESTELILSAIQGMDEVIENVNKVAHDMLELGAQSQKIGAVMDIVQEISEQTSILSLNAAIEAHGAGEEGRRFAVVAKEIRKLSEGTVEASKQITKLIEEIQKSATAAIVQVEESTKAVDKWAKTINQIGETFRNIESLVITANNAIKEIKTNTRQQTTACEQMADVVAEVKEVADKVAVSSKETEASMADLADLTVKLKELVSREIY
jgi:methyl-accepting chemotaxis protein